MSLSLPRPIRTANLTSPVERLVGKTVQSTGSNRSLTNFIVMVLRQRLAEGAPRAA